MTGSTTSVDKQWAKRYILDPLTAPEPSQETGPGSSFITPLGRAPSVKKDARTEQGRLRKSPQASPPGLTSPPRSQFHRTNPFSPTSRHASLVSEDPSRKTQSNGRPVSRPRVGRSNSTDYPPRSPDVFPSRGGSGLGRSQSVRQPGGASTGSFARGDGDDFEKGKQRLQRSGSLSQRYPGDMSHRPLDLIKRDVRAADRNPHLRRKGVPDTDTIDGLDTIGGVFHHGGPYDATLVSRNTNKLYSPVEAVKESNLAALKATPTEYIKDSLTKHVPLQGVAVIPPGGTDMSGNVMQYEEGADLMREPDAAGGPYKRWDFVSYHPDDMKGKGEPSYTVERDLKENKARLRRHAQSRSTGAAGEYEMLPREPPSGTARKDMGPQVRQRSISAASVQRSSPRSPGAALVSPMSPTSPSAGGEYFSTSDGLRRSNTTGRSRITEGLKRRFGSLRWKKNTEEA